MRTSPSHFYLFEQIPLASLVAEPLKYSWLNKLTYDLSGLLLWSMMGPAYNRFRVHTLGIGPQSGFLLDGVSQVTGFGGVVVPRPSDWSSNITMTGHWHFDEAVDIRRSQPISRTLQLLLGGPSPDSRLRPILMAFESVPLPDPVAVLRAAVGASTKLGVPIIIVAGETDFASVSASPAIGAIRGLRFDLVKGGGSASETAALESLSSGSVEVGKAEDVRVLVISSIAFTWALPRCSAVVHGGSATLTQAVMAAGIPNVVFTAFGDAFFWAARASTMGVSPPVHYPLLQLPEKLSDAIRVARHPQVIERAAAVGVAIRASGNGVQLAVRAICRFLSKPQNRHCDITCSWVNDEKAGNCSSCDASFSFFNRRHHCRSCGRLCCITCVPTRCYLPGYPENAPQLVCSKCVNARVSFLGLHKDAVLPEPPGGALSAAAAITDVVFTPPAVASLIGHSPPRQAGSTQPRAIASNISNEYLLRSPDGRVEPLPL